MGDPLPAFIGVWQKRNRIHAMSDFGIFYMYEEWSIDNKGLAEISIQHNDSKRIEFSKSYFHKKNRVGDFIYKGTSKDGKIYNGSWKGTENFGTFILAKVGDPSKTDLSEIEKTLGQLQHRVFAHRIKETREEFPYSPLKEALRDFKG